ncbi:uncharacterized protein [Aquarana catesbeiana]|uniref:uncharacterized protein n=1 Tax=Aquarana catesbeiana TaxID=8400 RepID=UPI003CC99438
MAGPQRPLHEMRDYIRTFSLDTLPHGNQGYQRVLLQLVGHIGSGKSALINSCKCVLDDGEFIMYAKATDAPGAVTSSRTAYELTPTISIVDNRPVIIMMKMEMAEVYAQLGNFRPLNGPVNKNWTFYDYMTTLEETELNPNYTDLIVPVLVDDTRFHFGSEQEEIQTFLRECKLMTGFIPIVVITNKGSRNTSEVRNKFIAMGAEQVIPVEIYTTENRERTRGKDTDILIFLYNALQDVAYYMSQQRDLRRERLERKKFLLKYMHDVEIEKKVQEALRKAEINRKEKR